MTKNISHIDNICSKISAKIELGLIDPLNAEKEKEKYFSELTETNNTTPSTTKANNPSFTYAINSETQKKYEEYTKKLHEVDFSKTDIDELFKQKKEESLHKIQLISAINTPEFSQISEKVYPPPTDALIRIAETILKTFRPSKKPTHIQKNEALTMLNEAFTTLGMDWSIENVKLISNARVHAVSERLLLKKHELFSRDYVKRLIVHEIGTHALRAENGKKQPLKLFRYGFPSYLETEEGLAAYNELRAGLMTNSILRNYAGRVLAISYAREGDFNYTYTKLRTYFTKHFAWKLALRAKRGVPQNQKGAYTKDAVYLRGLISVLQFSLENDITPLYVGKIGLQHIALLDKIPNIEPKIFTIDALLTKQELSASERAIDSVNAQRILLSGNQI
ncbi:MAG: tyrosine/phenylalanine carboxypeptidase domain-containing protein [Candidatus Woesearchaeota archaeon]